MAYIVIGRIAMASIVVYAWTCVQAWLHTCRRGMCHGTVEKLSPRRSSLSAVGADNPRDRHAVGAADIEPVLTFQAQPAPLCEGRYILGL